MLSNSLFSVELVQETTFFGLIFNAVLALHKRRIFKFSLLKSYAFNRVNSFNRLIGSERNPPWEKRWRLIHLPIILSQRKLKKCLIKTYRNVLKPSNPANTISIAHEQILQKNVAFSLYFTDCIRLAWYCGKMYSRHLFSYGGLSRLSTQMRSSQVKLKKE